MATKHPDAKAPNYPPSDEGYQRLLDVAAVAARRLYVRQDDSLPQNRELIEHMLQQQAKQALAHAREQRLYYQVHAKKMGLEWVDGPPEGFYSIVTDWNSAVHLRFKLKQRWQVKQELYETYRHIMIEQADKRKKTVHRRLNAEELDYNVISLVFKVLSLKDELNAACVCKQWRLAWRTGSLKHYINAAKTIQKRFQARLLRPVLFLNFFDHAHGVFIHRLQYQHRPRSEAQEVLANRVPPNGFILATGIKPHRKPRHSLFDFRCGAIVRHVVYWQEIRGNPSFIDLADSINHGAEKQQHATLMQTLYTFINRPDWVAESFCKVMLVPLKVYLKIFKPKEKYPQRALKPDVFRLLAPFDLCSDDKRGRGFYGEGRSFLHPKNRRPIKFEHPKGLPSYEMDFYPHNGLYTPLTWRIDPSRYGTGYLQGGGIRRDPSSLRCVVPTFTYYPHEPLAPNHRVNVNWNAFCGTLTLARHPIVCKRPGYVCWCTCCVKEKGLVETPEWRELQIKAYRKNKALSAMVTAVYHNLQHGVLHDAYELEAPEEPEEIELEEINSGFAVRRLFTDSDDSE